MEVTNGTLIWAVLASAAATAMVIGTLAIVMTIYQRRLAKQAAEWGRHLLAAQEEVAQRIARDLHDDIGQRIWATKIELEGGNLGSAVTQLTAIGEAVRSISRGLYPATLDRVGLRPALEDLASSTDNRLAADFRAELANTPDITGPKAVALYRVAQEAIKNADMHSGAKSITLDVEEREGRIHLQVSDDGRGMPSARDVRQDFGVRSMKERMEAVGGTLSFHSASEGGVVVCAMVPL